MKTTQVNVVKIGETEKAYKVIYLHFENPAEFAIVWLPKSQVKVDSVACWTIPMWLKNKTAESAKRYTAKKYTNEFKIQDYLYGFDNSGYYNSQGKKVTL